MKHTLIAIFLIKTFVTNAQLSVTDTLPINHKNYLQQLVTPASLFVGAGIAALNFNPSIDQSIYNKRNSDLANFNTNADDYLQFAPIVLAYGFDFIGIMPKTDFINRSVILFKSEVIVTVTVFSLKGIIHKTRPDASDKTSFPSGHTAEAFTAATFLSEEFGERYRWVPYLSYSIASSVGVLRILNDKHYLSDVLVGAGIGYLSTKVAYWTHQYKWGKKKRGF